MSRIGITLLDVETAALQIQAQGKTPTIDRIRAILNTGSNTTIGEHLKTWRAKQIDGKGNLPQTLLVLVTKLWEELQADANQRMDDLQIEHEESVKMLKQTVTQLSQENTQLKKDLHLQQEAFLSEQQVKQSSIAQLDQLSQSHEKALIAQQGLVEKWDESKAENARLHQLASQMQANLSHYQDAIQQLRTQQVIEFEKQHDSWKQEITTLKKSLSEVTLEAKRFEQEIIQNKMLLSQNQEKFSTLSADYKVLQSKFHETAQSLAVITGRFKDCENTMRDQNDLIAKKDKYINSIEKENAVLFDKITRFEKELQSANEKVESLRDEKLFLSQKNTELLCNLKQLTNKKEIKTDLRLEA